MTQDFDLVALQTALDDRRQALGLSWSDVGAALGVSAGTLRGLGTRRRAEGDGVLRVMAWLGRSPESFVTGRSPESGQVLPLGRARVLRFDGRALYAALDAARAARGLTWREVAAVSGAGSVAGLTRLRAGGRVMFPRGLRGLGGARGAGGSGSPSACGGWRGSARRRPGLSEWRPVSRRLTNRRS